MIAMIHDLKGAQPEKGGEGRGARDGLILRIAQLLTLR